MLAESGRVEAKDKAIHSDLDGERFVNHLFIRLVAKGRTFRRVDFKYAIFDGCYLRGCVFDSCDFTGAKFTSSNMHGSSFTGCKFDYATFDKTIVDNDILDVGCPGPENLRMRFARTLRTNYQQLGDAASANKAIGIELEATHDHLLKAWRSRESYYRNKYPGWRRAKAFGEWVQFRCLDFVWGNGESPLKLFRFVFLLLFAMALYDAVAFRPVEFVGSYAAALKEAPQVFLGVSQPAKYSGLYLSMIVVARLTMVALFLSIIVKRFNRR